MFNNSTIGGKALVETIKSASKKVTETDGQWCDKLAIKINGILQSKSLPSVNTAYADIKDVELTIIEKSQSKPRPHLIFALANLVKVLNTFCLFEKATEIGHTITQICNGLSDVFLTELADLNRSISKPKTLKNSFLKKVSQTSGVGHGSSKDKLEKLKNIAKVIIDFCPQQNDHAYAIIKTLNDMSGSIDTWTNDHISAIHTDYTRTSQQVATKDDVLLPFYVVGEGFPYQNQGGAAEEDPVQTVPNQEPKGLPDGHEFVAGSQRGDHVDLHLRHQLSQLPLVNGSSRSDELAQSVRPPSTWAQGASGMEEVGLRFAPSEEELHSQIKKSKDK